MTLIGHRVVHGGERFTAPTLITPEVEATLQELIPLAPLHNPPALKGCLGPPMGSGAAAMGLL